MREQQKFDERSRESEGKNRHQPTAHAPSVVIRHLSRLRLILKVQRSRPA
jgi:hypothetical protein